jgi:hypothetical protein
MGRKSTPLSLGRREDSKRKMQKGQEEVSQISKAQDISERQQHMQKHSM